ncbi:hypothetical protein TNCV_4775771 [Trichonephila clavipes]|nr:hypothetical protein TNCV_4775771 [Trichonephila clavipes]
MRQKVKSKDRNRKPLERASQEQSNGTNITPYGGIVEANAIGDDPIEPLQCDRSALESEVLLERQNLAISETWMEDSMAVNVPGFDLRSPLMILLSADKLQLHHRWYIIIFKSQSGGVTIYSNINSFTDCNRVNFDISNINLGMKDAKAGDVCLANVKVNGTFRFILG